MRFTKFSALSLDLRVGISWSALKTDDRLFFLPIIGKITVFITIQSTLVISKSKGPSETLRDIRSSTYQMCSIEENTNGATKFHK